MLFDNTKHQIWFIIGFAIFNIILISILHWIAQDVKLDYGQVPVFNVGDVITVVLGVYAAFTFLILLHDILGKNPDLDRKNLFFYGLKSILILVVVFYDGVVLMNTIPTFFNNISNSGSESSLWEGIALSTVTLFFGIFFTSKHFQIKINYSKTHK